MNQLARLFIAFVLCLVSLSSCSTSKLDTEGEDFVTGILAGQKSHWDVSKVVPYIDPASGATTKDVDTLFKMYNNLIGPIKAVSPITRTSFNSGVGVNIPDFQGTYTADLTCAKGKAVVTVAAVHRDGKWTIMTFNVNTDLKKLNAPDRLESQHFVDKVAKELCTTWKIETLIENGDASFIDDLKKGDLAVKGILLASKKGLGNLKSFTGLKFDNLKPMQGETLYTYVATEEFERAHAQLILSVGKQAGVWKIHGFTINSSTQLSGKAK